jgi:hypothetical protein
MQVAILPPSFSAQLQQLETGVANHFLGVIRRQLQEQILFHIWIGCDDSPQLVALVFSLPQA